MSHSNVFGGAERSGAGSADPSISLSRADLAMLLSAERRLAGALSKPAEVLRFFLSAVEETAALLRVDRALLCLIDSEDPNLLRVMAGTGPMADEEGEILPVEGSFEGRVFAGLEPMRTRDLGAEPGIYQPRPNQRRGGPAIAVPLRLRNRPIGVLLVAREPEGVPFLERDAELLREFAVPIASAIEAMRQFDSARRSRESVDAWNREQALRRWLARYEALATARVELVFRLLPSGAMEWGSSTETLLGVQKATFAPTLEDFLGMVAPADIDAVRNAIGAISLADGPNVISTACGIIVSGSIQSGHLSAWRHAGESEVVGVIGTTPIPTAGSASSDETRGEGAGEVIVRALRHQINNPLAAVIGRAQLLIREERVQQDPMLRQAVETILFESERIGRFVRQLHSAEAIQRLSDRLPGEE